MTTEEKVRAYDEALEKAKIEINTKGIGETVNLCYQLFPQLAENDDEESEDERIRKRLIEYFEGFRMGNAEVRWEGLIVQEVLAWLKKQKECVADNSKTSTDEDERIINQLITLVNINSAAGEVLLIPTNKEELVAWLNKCKESLHTQETCEENANSFADDIIEVRSFQRGMEEGRRLEKQKEQKPVKCIDFDNEFENQVSHLLASVLNGEHEYTLGFVKHAAQSLLGYAKNEMKPELSLMGGDTDTYFDDLRMTTKPLTSREWFDEGIKYAQRLQKEQKPNIELIQRSWYMEGYHDREFGQEPKWILKTGEDGPKHELNPRYGQPLAEQRPTEEQLHNLNEAIKGLRMDGFDRMADSLDSLYNILKTQEQKPNYCLYGGDPSVGRCRWCYAAYSARLADVHTDKEKEYVRTIKSIISDFIRDKKPENLAYYQRIYDWLDGRHVPISCGHENGFMSKEWSEEDEKMLRTIISDGSRGVELDSKQIFWLKSLRPQPKLEWSEEDKKILNHLIDKVQENWHIRMPNGHYFGISNDEKETFSSWLKSLPERFNLQPKQKWSEEDEQRIAEIEFAVMQMNTKRVDTKDKCLAWLKSLRPQLKKELSIEKAIQWLDDTFYFLDNSSGRGRDCEITTHDFDSLEEMYDSFRKAVTVDSEPRWKPSEEQMEALKSTIVDVAKFSKRGGRQVELENEPYYSALHSLYCNLEKLM